MQTERTPPALRVRRWLSARLQQPLAARLTPQERKTLLLVLALFALGAAVRWLRLSGAP